MSLSSYLNIGLLYTLHNYSPFKTKRQIKNKRIHKPYKPCQLQNITGQIMLSGTNSPPTDISTQYNSKHFPVLSAFMTYHRVN